MSSPWLPSGLPSPNRRSLRLGPGHSRALARNRAGSVRQSDQEVRPLPSGNCAGGCGRTGTRSRHCHRRNSPRGLCPIAGRSGMCPIGPRVAARHPVHGNADLRPVSHHSLQWESQKSTSTEHHDAQKLLRVSSNCLRRFCSPTREHKWGQGDLNPHRPYGPNDFKSRASTDSATPPCVPSAKFRHPRFLHETAFCSDHPDPA